MSLETHIAAAEDKLIAGLQFTGTSTASYIESRRSATFQPQSGAFFSPNGIKTMRFNLADMSGFCDLSTIRMCMIINNTHESDSLTPHCDSPMSMFSRIRVIANGSEVIEDVELLPRTCQMMSLMKTSQKRYADAQQLWGGGNTDYSFSSPVNHVGWAFGTSRTVVFPLFSSFLNSGKYLPLDLVPLVIELDVGEGTDALSHSQWNISRPRILADVCTVDSALHNSYRSHILNGKTIPIPYTGCYSCEASMPSANLYSFVLNRGFSRISSILVTFMDSLGPSSTRFYCPNAPATVNTTTSDQFRWNITVGSERFPSFDSESMAECFYRLQHCMKCTTGNDTLSISPYAYRNDQFILGQSLEKAGGVASHTGVNTRSGATLTVNVQNAGAAQRMFITIFFDSICEVSGGGVKVLQ